MKKLLALALALMMALSGIALAEPAEDQDVYQDEDIYSEGTYNYEDNPMLAAMADSLGEFVTLDQLGLKMWLPNGMAPVAPEGDGALYAFYSEELKFSVSVFLETLPDDVDTNDLSALVEYFAAKASRGASLASVNGFPCVVHVSEQDERLSFRLDDGTVATFAFSFQNTEAPWTVELYFPIVLFSIQKADA